MKLSRVFLALQALLFLPYGLYLLVQPEALADLAGVRATSLSGQIELQAMYGGLQAAIGVLCFCGAVQRALTRTALTALLFLFTGLAVPRVTLGLVYQDLTGYTLTAMILEVSSCLLAFYLLQRSTKHLQQAGA